MVVMGSNHSTSRKQNKVAATLFEEQSRDETRPVLCHAKDGGVQVCEGSKEEGVERV